MATISNLGLKIDWNDRWTEDDTISLIEAVEKIHDTASVTVEGIEDHRTWNQVTQLGKKKSRSPGACKKKFVELWVTYELVVNHGCTMPPSFTDRVFQKMTHYSEGDGPVDAENPKRRVSVECIKECVNNRLLLTLLGIHITDSKKVGGVTSAGADLIDDQRPEILRPTTPELSSRRRSERLAKRKSQMPTSSEEEEESCGEQTEGPVLAHKSDLPLLQSGPNVLNTRRSLRLAKLLAVKTSSSRKDENVPDTESETKCCKLLS